ncbi:MAG: geranylgeranyl reductase family protein [Dehalococcoidia bacterium]
MQYDAIVVGAGPAGSTAARELAQGGAKVLLLDKASFPRDKPCGGGVTIRAAELLPFDLAPVTERTIRGVHISHDLHGGFTRRYPKAITYLTQRRHLDLLLAQRAESAGATFHDGDGVTAVELDERGVTVQSRTGSYRAGVLIGADGANGIVAKLTGLTGARDVAVALEGNIPCTEGVPAQWTDLVGMDLGGVPGGYGWLFPKGDHLNVGVGGWQYLAGSFRERLSRICSFYGVREATMYGLRGHHLPVRRRGAPLARDRVALVGDAAGLIDPLSGEGIYAAMFSGRQAASAVGRLLSGEALSLSPYAAAIERGLMPDLDASRRFQDVFYLVPGVYVGLLQHSDRIWNVLARLIRGEQTYLGFRRKLGPLSLAVDALSLAVRHTPLKVAAGLPE